MNITEIVKKANLPEGEYIIAASGIMNALDIRESEDIDVVVTPNLYKKLLSDGWREVDKGEYKVVMNGPFEVGLCWDSVNGIPNLEDLLKDSVTIGGIKFVGLERVRAWKAKEKRPKDLKDIELIDNYLAKKEYIKQNKLT